MRIAVLTGAGVALVVVALIAESRRNTQVWHSLPNHRS